MGSLRFTTVVTFLILSFLLHSPTVVEGGECFQVMNFCIGDSQCSETCLHYLGDKMVRSECEIPPLELKDPPPAHLGRMCYCYYICDKASEATM
ncbi:unnamed protein product [Brassica rapa]|uniref:Defensin-like protein n=2 Tax=Brassica TaxID=3705 RepID=A0A8D9GW49_BRACM|nr:unnamed protein product [Brassica napus]CAG7887284.1 unnamed protein product [Brassica rapa]